MGRTTKSKSLTAPAYANTIVNSELSVIRTIDTSLIVEFGRRCKNKITVIKR
jgi:hypothetical protein